MGSYRASGLSSCHLTLGIFCLCSCGCSPERHGPGPEEGHPEIRAAQAGARGRHSAHQLVSGASAPPSALPGRRGGCAGHERALLSPGLCSGCGLERRAPCPEPLKRAGVPVPTGPALAAPLLHYHAGSWVAARGDTSGRAMCLDVASLVRGAATSPSPGCSQPPESPCLWFTEFPSVGPTCGGHTT